MMNFWQRNDFLFSMTNAKIRHDYCLKVLHSFTNEIVENRRETIGKEDFEVKLNYQDQEDDDVGIKKKMALLDVLLKATVDGKSLTNAEVAEEVDTFMFEG
jgi:cytochrome P450 family 4